MARSPAAILLVCMWTTLACRDNKSEPGSAGQPAGTRALPLEDKPPETEVKKAVREWVESSDQRKFSCSSISFHGDTYQVVGDPQVLGTSIDARAGLARVRVRVKGRISASPAKPEQVGKECEREQEYNFRKYDTGWLLIK